LNDEGIPGFWRGLGLPGLVDVHVHFMPERVLRKVWAYFDAAEEHYGVAWPVAYRGSDEERLALLRGFGVVAFPALVYPHKPGMAEWLSRWAVDFGLRTPGCVPTATFYPEPGAAVYVRRSLAAGARIFKVHVQVGGYDPRDPLLDEVWGLLAEAAVPVVTHCGSGPNPGEYTGPGIIEAVLRRHPGLTLVIAHMGATEYAEHLALATRYPNVRLDTTMAFTDFMQARAPYPPDLLPRLADLGDRIVLGTDFPNIPYPYSHQLEALARLDLGDDWLRRVLHHNGAELLKV
jgi:predicted TIM-barrel fold metal-dependent hydrolase